MPDSVNYPDLLGLITGGQRCNISSAQVALAIRPRIVRAGRPFEVILLVQNASDGEIDVTMTLHLPAADAKKQHDRFITQTQRLVVGVKGAEAGYVVLPVTTLSDTAISDGYKIGLGCRGQAARQSESNSQRGRRRPVPFERLSEATQTAIEALRTLTCYADKHRSLLEAPVTVMSGSVGKMTDFTPGWVNLCKLSDFGDNRLLLHAFGSMVQTHHPAQTQARCPVQAAARYD